MTIKTTIGASDATHETRETRLTPAMTGQWIEVTTRKGGHYTAKVLRVDDRVVELDLALDDAATGRITLKTVTRFHDEIVAWTPSARFG